MKLEDEILISAYLDGEVSTDEKLRAEQLLAASAEARQLAEELRIVRTRLQDLPRFGLPADFADQTLRRAEQELAAARAVDSAVGVSTGGTSLPGRKTESSVSPPASVWTTWRGFAWAAVALAAGLMIWITNLPNAEQRVEVAKRESTASTKSPSQIAATKADSVEAPEAMPAPTTPATPAPSHIAIESGKEDLQPPPAQLDGYGGLPSFSAPGSKPSPADRPSPKMVTGQVEDRAPRNANRNEPIQVNENQNGPGFGQGGGQSGMSVEQVVDAAGAKVLIVSVDIAPDAAARGDFDQLLAKHQIVVEDLPLAKKQNDAQRRDLSDKLEQSQKLAGGQADDPRARQALGEGVPDLEHWLPKSETAGELEVFYVEASPEQIKQTIRDLTSTRMSFSTVEVAKFLPIRESGEVQKRLENTQPAPPAPPATDISKENSSASELLSPKPSEKDQGANDQQQKAEPNEKQKLEPGEQSKVLSPLGRARRLALPSDRPTDNSSVSGARSKSSGSPMGATRTPPPPPESPIVVDPDRSLPAPANGVNQPAMQRALFVFRKVEANHSPAAAKPVEPEAAPQGQR